MSRKTVAVAVDHGGHSLKQACIDEIRRAGCDALDLGTDGLEPVDYADFAFRLVDALAAGQADSGILVCGTGIGVSIAANRHPGIRAALCYDEETAALARRHNDANVMCLGGRKTAEETARAMVGVFLSAEFEGGRHERRIAKLERRRAA